MPPPHAVTGTHVPGKQPSTADYTKACLPWFEYYDDKLNALKGARRLAGLDSVAAKGVKLGDKPLPANDAVKPKKIAPIGSRSTMINEGKW